MESQLRRSVNPSISKEIIDKQLQVLTHFQRAIGDLGYETRLIESGDESQPLPGPLLVVGVEKDALGRDRLIHFGFLPLPDEDDFDYLSLVQCYAPLPFAVSDGRRTAVEKTLAELNCQTALGYFGVTAEGNLFYRYVLATEKWALVGAETVQQLLLVFIHMQDRFAPEIEAMVEGEEAT